MCPFSQVSGYLPVERACESVMLTNTDYALNQGFQGDRAAVRELWRLIGLNVEECAALCLVSPETFRRWLSDRPPPVPYVRLLAILAGYVPWPGWEGWICRDGKLYAPRASKGIGPDELMGLPYLQAMAQQYQRKDRIRKRHEPPEHFEAVISLVRLVSQFNTEAEQALKFLQHLESQAVQQSGECVQLGDSA